MRSAIDVRRPSAEMSVAQRPRVAIDVLTIALGLSLWMATGCLVLAIAEGLGAHPLRRLVIGVSVVIACCLALKWRRTICSTLRVRPWLVLPLAGIQLSIVALDELVGSPFIGFLLTSIGIATIVARTFTVWMCVLLLDLGYLLLVLFEQSPAGLVTGADLGTVLGVLVGNVAAAVPLMLLRQRFDRVIADAPQTLQDIHEGAPAFTPALARAIAPERQALPAAPPDLTPAERRVVDALANGLTPQQIAFDQDVSLSTIRTHIKHAKRKLGARTLPELAGMTARPDSPDHDDGQ